VWFLFSPFCQSFWSHSLHMISPISLPCFDRCYYVLDIAILSYLLTSYSILLILLILLNVLISAVLMILFVLDISTLVFAAYWSNTRFIYFYFAFNRHMSISPYDISQVCCYSIYFISLCADLSYQVSVAVLCFDSCISLSVR